MLMTTLLLVVVTRLSGAPSTNRKRDALFDYFGFKSCISVLKSVRS